MELKDIFERQHKRVYRIAMLMLNNVSDAEDAVQNVFLKYIEKGSSFEDIEHEKAW
ncbi:MAG: RNA polymerase sigma factor, partial [Lachnospiraceae bacterium]|nr:RNA polymerase sigma factor [Lachnospiraceae bacterium]